MQDRQEYYREYALRPEVKERRKRIMKKYLAKPEVKERRKIQMKEYNQRAEVREYQRLYWLAKKIVIAIMVLLSIVACVTMDPLPLNWQYKIESPYQDHALNIIVLYICQYYDTFRGYQGDLKGIKISFQNIISKPIIINWNKSALAYNGRSHRVFITGQKYIDAGKDVPLQVLVPGTQINVGVYPADNIYYTSGRYGGWKMRGFRTSAISCLICVVIDNEERFYTAEITIDSQ